MGAPSRGVGRRGRRACPVGAAMRARGAGQGRASGGLGAQAGVWAAVGVEKARRPSLGSGTPSPPHQASPLTGSAVPRGRKGHLSPGASAGPGEGPDRPSWAARSAQVGPC